MRIGFIGLGKMGHAMVLQLAEKGIDVVAFNRSKEKTEALVNENREARIRNQEIKEVKGVGSVAALIAELPSPRIVWLMVAHGEPVDGMIAQLLAAGLAKDDIAVDGGNSFYKDSIRRHGALKEKGIRFVDVGTSGGLEGARNGACVMAGGDEADFLAVKPVLEAIAIPGGVAYFGAPGAGHFVKMVHNGVEYGMLQAIGEGFAMLEKAPFPLDLPLVAANWNNGSVVRGWLMELLARALKEQKGLEGIEGRVGGGSTGEWTVATAKELGIGTPVIAASLEARKQSQTKPSFAGKIVAALRNQFGGHTTTPKTTTR